MCSSRPIAPVKSAAISASTTSTSVATQPSAYVAGTAAANASKTQCNLASAKRLPVRLPPPYQIWLLQAEADMRVPQASKQHEASVFIINAIPPSMTRPIASTSSSEAGSPTPTRILQSSARATTPLPTKSAASASSSVSQSAGLQGPAMRSHSPATPRGSTLPEHDS